MFFRKGRKQESAPAAAPFAASPSTPPVAKVAETKQLMIAAPLPYERACCCGALPRVRVLLPKADPAQLPVAPGAGEGWEDGYTDLLLCDHHYRVSAARLAALGAIAVGNDGRFVSDTVTAPAAAAQRSRA